MLLSVLWLIGCVPVFTTVSYTHLDVYKRQGYLTPATEFAGEYTHPVYHFDSKIYENRVFDSKGVADPSVEIRCV